MKKLALVMVLLVLITIKTVYGLGIATDYGSEVIELPIGTYHGEYSFRLQNMGEEEVNLDIHLASDNNIAKLKDEKPIFTLLPKTTDNEFIIDLDLPDDAKIGDVFEVAYTIKEVSESEGQINVGQAIQQRFEVKVVEKTAETKTKLSWKGLTGFLTKGFTTGRIILALAIVGIVCFAVVWKLRLRK